MKNDIFSVFCERVNFREKFTNYRINVVAFGNQIGQFLYLVDGYVFRYERAFIVVDVHEL